MINAHEYVVSMVTAASAASLNFRPGGGDDVTMTSRQYSTRTQQHRQVPVTGASYSGVEGFQSEPRPEATSALGSRVRRTQSSTAVYRHDQVADSARQNGSMVGVYSLGSTYDEGDYDPVDSMLAGTVTTPLSTMSLQRQQRHTTSSSSAYTQQQQPRQQQQQQQLTSIVRGHRHTHSTGLTDLDSRPTSQVAYNDGSASRVRVETDRGGGNADSLDSRNRRVGCRFDEIQRQSTARRQDSSGNVMVVSNAGYEPTTLDHRTPQSVVQSLAAPNSGPDTVSTSPMLNGDSGRYQSSVRYDQNTTVLRQHVQAPSYATTHRVQQTTGPGSSVFQRAVIVDSSKLIPQQQQQQQTGQQQLDLLEQQLQQQHRQQQEMLMKQQEEEKQQLQQRLTITRQQREQQRRSDVDQRQPRDQLQHQILRQRQLAVTQNVAASPSRSTPDRIPVNQIGEDDGQSRYKSSTVTTVTSHVERSGTEVMMGNGQSRSASRPVQVVDRRQSPSNFSTSSNSSGIFLQSGGGGGQSMMISADDYTVRRADLIGGSGRGDSRRGGGADTPSSMSSAASWRSPATIGGTEQRFSTASSSGATEQSSVELGNDSSLDRASSFVGERRFLVSTF